MDPLENYLHYFYSWELLQLEHFWAKGCCSRKTCVSLFVISQIYSMLSTRTCYVFMQRMMLALKENSSAKVIPRKEENSYTTKHKGNTLRVGFSTNKASWVNSKEKTTSFLETEYPSDIEQKSWLGKRQHTPCSRGKVMIERNHESVLLHQKKHVMKQKWWKACMFLTQIFIFFLMTRKICSEMFV